MKIKFKKLNHEAKTPILATTGSVGFDLTAVKVDKLGNCRIKCHSGIAVELPEGYAAFVFPRSSVWKCNCFMSNSIGVIDRDYRGEITAVFDCYDGDGYSKGDRFAQLVIMPVPAVEFEEADELSTTERGTGGYGSTGR